VGRSGIQPLRSLPRIFLPGATAEQEFIELPKEEVDKLRKVLRLEEGDAIAVLPNDGTLIRCEFRARKAWPQVIERPNTEAEMSVTIAQALPKADRIDTIVRMCTELGVKHFVFFAGDRSVVKWDESKRQDRLRRLEAVARESSEQCFRTNLPTIRFEQDLRSVLALFPEAIVLSEVEGISPRLTRRGNEMALVVGPEGGWSPKELELIGARGVTLGPRVLRTDTAGAAAASILLLADTEENKPV